MIKLKTRVDKTAIIESLKKQLTEHEAAHVEAKKKWKEKMLAVAEKIVEAGGKLKKFPRALEELQYVPRSYAEELKALIKRFEMALDNDFELDSGDYETLMEGKWHWTHEFSAMNSRYGSTGATGCTGDAGATGVTGSGGGGSQEIEAVLDEDEIEG